MLFAPFEMFLFFIFFWSGSCLLLTGVFIFVSFFFGILYKSLAFTLLALYGHWSLEASAYGYGYGYGYPRLNIFLHITSSSSSIVFTALYTSVVIELNLFF